MADKQPMTEIENDEPMTLIEMGAEPNPIEKRIIENNINRAIIKSIFSSGRKIVYINNNEAAQGPKDG